MQDELMRLRHENQTLRAEIGMRKFHESKEESVDVELVDEEVKKHYLTTGQDALKPSKGQRVSKDKSDE